MIPNRYLLACAAIAFASDLNAALLRENFNDVRNLDTRGWVLSNLSSPLGETDWFQGNSAVFTSQAGSGDAYVGANFLNAAATGGSIDNWLISPTLTLSSPAILQFYTRTEIDGFADTLELRFSAGSSSDTADFTTLLLTVGDPDPYPSSDWQLFSVVLPDVAQGRFAFRYNVADSNAANYIGIDSVVIDRPTVPAPDAAALTASALGLLLITRRKRRDTSSAQRAERVAPGRWRNLLAIAASMLALGAPVAAADTASAPAETTSDATVTDGGSEAGLTVVRDAVTGALRAPTAAEIAALRSRAPSAASIRNARLRPAVSAKRMPTVNGVGRVRLGDSAPTYAVATRGDAGGTVLHCVDGEDAAHALLDSSAASSTTTTEGNADVQ